MLIRLDAAKNVNLIYCAFFKFKDLSKFLYWDNFDSVLLFIKVVCCPVDFAVFSRTDYLIQSIIIDVLYHCSFEIKSLII